ncbi:hypothetical protein VNO80_06372 [Phaseolus coccineus]|uniref:Uncharacterized protein n=1 Tax=Phaseolus coccineus TaxID=3886 RepID=A0AAN9RIN6_PHACN
MAACKEERKANRKRIWLKGKDSYCMVMTIQGAIPTMSNNMDKPKPCYEKGVTVYLFRFSVPCPSLLSSHQSKESGTRKENGKQPIERETIAFTPLAAVANG